VGRLGLCVCFVVTAACGRIGFGSLDVGSDGATGDGLGDAPAPLSCSGLSAICGPMGTSPCCGSSLVPGGTFYRSYDLATDNAYPSMSDPATVSTFRLDTYEVTVGRFRQFVDAGLGTQTSPPPPGAGARTLNGLPSQAGWDSAWITNLYTDTAAVIADLQCDANHPTWTDAPGANEALPINCVTWFEAFAFCAWDGGFLPTEAEWNYAAAGGSEQRAYPWSSPASSLTTDCSYANYFPDSPAGTYCVNSANAGAVNRVGSESPKGDGKYGQADLAGNVNEWVLDWYQLTYPNPCEDCAYLPHANDPVFRGGSYGNNPSSLRAGYRYSGVRFGGLGFRCARTP
jgi:formylglycine-generating enzyme required for sulfatase activity